MVLDTGFFLFLFLFYFSGLNNEVERRDKARFILEAFFGRLSFMWPNRLPAFITV